MATCDALAHRGLTLGRLIDLAGFPLSTDEYASLFSMVVSPGTRAIVFNFFTSVLGCDGFAEAIVKAFGDRHAARVVARLKGYRAEVGHSILREAGIFVTEDLKEACDVAATLARCKERN